MNRNKKVKPFNSATTIGTGTRIEHAAIYRPNCSGSGSINGSGNRVNVGPDYRPIDGRHHQHSKRPILEPLLRFHVLVAGEKDLKSFTLDQREQRTVFDAAPFHADNRFNFMLWQKANQLTRNILIEQNLQSCAYN